MGKEKSAPLGYGVDKEEGILGSLEEAILDNKGVSGISEENEALLNNTINKTEKWEKNGAQVEGQFQDTNAWRKKNTYVKIYDLSDSEEIEEYSALVNAAHQEDPQAIIIDEDRQFCKTTESWKILVQVVEIEYKKKI